MTYTFTNRFGTFRIEQLGNKFYVHGNIKAAQHEFKKIHRMPPNAYGNFYGREKAGNTACEELIKSLRKDDIK